MSRIGCHVSISGGIDKAPEMAHEFGCEVMQIFTRSPQGGPVPELTKETIKKFKTECTKYKIQNTYIHTPYFINLASINNRIYYGSISAIKTELERASLLGAKYVMTHLGSAKELSEKEAIRKTIEGIKKILDGYKGSAKLLIENSAGAGKIIGSNFKEINEILRALKNYSFLAGICLDTQHSFASGWEILDKDIGLKNVKLIHANDSASEAGSRKDRHEHIGKGEIGMNGFKKIAQFAKKNKIDLICETDYPGVVEDIKILKNILKS
ncbi:deoxyribonuclease IV [Patescibacteria group bacterium]|nr:deoxyribonuclease IV [Patescibacteria group bacterium]MBU2219436.1 deoxyribonuclease IV [Patescibacteria group bacterium]